MNFPIQVNDYSKAVELAQEISLKNPTVIVYIYGKIEGGYVIDNQAGEFSNERLVMKLLNGQKI